MAAPGTSSPSKHNPFARPRAAASGSGITSFSRASLLPPVPRTRAVLTTEPSVAESSTSAAAAAAFAFASTGAVSFASPANPTATTTTPHITPHAKSAAATPRRPTWRLLWRGGLEVGPDGWRLDGATFVAHLAFPTGTPASSSRTFGSPVPAAFSAVGESTDTDLCLSLESLRGRKYLQVREVISLSDEDIDVDDSGVQMSATSPLLAAFFTGLLCRHPKLTPLGKTTTGVVIGLGDEGVDTASMMVYGQRQADGSLRLCVGRRRVVVAAVEKKIRPGEPLPRAPLLFPKAPKRPPPPIPRRSLSRAGSVSSIYAPPQLSRSTSEAPVPRSPQAQLDRSLSLSRRGEKRRREDEEDRNNPTGKGRIAPVAEDEDIFGSRPSLVPARTLPQQQQQPPKQQKQRKQPPEEKDMNKAEAQQEQNKATIRKQTMVLLEARGCGRQHVEFKKLFSFTTQGVKFALRNEMEVPIEKSRVRALVGGHLVMYFPLPLSSVAPSVILEEEGEGGEAEAVAVEGEDTDCDEPGPDPNASMMSDMTERSPQRAAAYDMRTPSPRR